MGGASGLKAPFSRVDTALKQLGQIREYDRRLKGLEQEVRTRGLAGGLRRVWGSEFPSPASVSLPLPRSSTVAGSWTGWPRL